MDLKSEEWQIKKLTLQLPQQSVLEIVVFDDERFSILADEKMDGEYAWFTELESLDSAVRLRDFLNYAIPPDYKLKKTLEDY